MMSFPAHLPTHLGRGIASCAGFVAVLSFVAMPWVSLGVLGNYTAVQVAQAASQQLHTQQLGYLWLELLLSLALTITALVSFFTPTRERMLSMVIIGLGTVAFVGMIGTYMFLAQQVLPFVSLPLTALIGSGFWLYTVSIAIATAGGIIQLISSTQQSKRTYISKR